MPPAALLTLGCLPALLGTTQQPPAPALTLHIMLDWTKSDFVEPLIDLAAGCGYKAVMLEVGGNVALKAQGGTRADWSPDEIRRLVSHAHRRGLEVIPCTSLLSHPECAPRHPKYIDPEMGWRLWEPGAYEFISAIVEEICDLFDHPRYFHARLDEAGPAVAANSERLGMSPADFLADHIRRLRDICRQNGARLVIWHDMLAPPDQIPFANSNGGPPLNCWRAVEAIPKDIVINFWLYDFEAQHALGPEFFLSRRFEVWLSPWLHPRPMGLWAARRGLPILQTIWIDPSSVPFCEWQLRAIVTASDARLRHNQPPPGGLRDATLRAVQLVMRPPARHGQLLQVTLPETPPASMPDAPNLSLLLASLPAKLRMGMADLALRCPLVAWQPSPSLDDTLASAEKPLRVVRADGASRLIDGVNRPRGEGELILYTSGYGPRTGTNIYGTEHVVVDGTLQEIAPDCYGIGDSHIPPGGFVLSAHCAGDGPAFLSGMGRWQPVKIVDARWQNLLSQPPAASSSQVIATLPANAKRPVRALWLIHATLHNMPMRSRESSLELPAVGQVLVTTDKGDEVLPVLWGHHVACWRTPRWLVDALGRPARNVWLAWATDTPDGGVACLWATHLPLPRPLRVRRLRLQITPAGREAGWVVAALALEF